jgi:two-component system, OmpR family, lantibiotic biosynthesis response regulator NisR/SpaR
MRNFEKKPEHILVVDDEPEMLVLICSMLESAGYAVTTVNNGQDALAKFKERSPDLVLLDIRMSGITGYQVLKQIRESSEVPVIMITGIADTEAVNRSLNLGADDYIKKPFSSKILVARVQAKLRRKRANN